MYDTAARLVQEADDQPEDLQGIKFRTVGLSIDVFQAMGAAVNALPGGEIVLGDGPRSDRGSRVQQPLVRPSARLRGRLQVLHDAKLSPECEQLEITFNKTKFDALSPELKAILKYSGLAATADNFAWAHDRYSKDLEEIKKRGVQVIKTPDSVLTAQLEAWDRVLEAQTKEPFFKKVIDSQKAWAKRTVPYWAINNNNSAALAEAYKHFFG